VVLAGQEGQGTLSAWVHYSSSKIFKEIHEATVNALLVMVILHLAGVALESWRHRENLVRAMLSGRKVGTPDAATSSIHPVSALLLLASLVTGGLWYFGNVAVATVEHDASYKINRSIDPHETPLRISSTPYWKGKHGDISAQVWDSPRVGSRANCLACHQEAERGLFVGAAIPRDVAAKVAMR